MARVLLNGQAYFLFVKNGNYILQNILSKVTPSSENTC